MKRRERETREILTFDGIKMPFEAIMWLTKKEEAVICKIGTTNSIAEGMSATILVYKWPETLHVYNKPLIFNLWHPYCNQKIDTQMLIYTLKEIKK